ncbi:hypothetical protein Y1Q_0003075 [Alligator mississippiensis]|uniref:Uncharacterized protein n=1 Tax=Alligator mississippiensis TaxID=8496 RepID=A0A151MDB7_ALLMI|nr:hypothetical protein Y1Q_0003075 [Alligator mississippiensis]
MRWKASVSEKTRLIESAGAQNLMRFGSLPRHMAVADKEKWSRAAIGNQLPHLKANSPVIYEPWVALVSTGRLCQQQRTTCSIQKPVFKAYGAPCIQNFSDTTSPSATVLGF